jgi:hypothetical protein
MTRWSSATCAAALRSVTAHLRVHGWTKGEYCEAFGLERGQSLEGQETRKLRAAAFAARLVFHPAVRDGSAAGRQRARTAAEVATRHGYRDLGAFVLARIAAGASLAEISRAAGLHKDWLSRHLADVDPAAAAAVLLRRPAPPDARWRPALRRLGFPDVASYLADRHTRQHRTVNSIPAEVGLSNHAVAAALRRHGGRSAPGRACPRWG